MNTIEKRFKFAVTVVIAYILLIGSLEIFAAMPEINIQLPTSYTDDSALDKNDISHIEVCVIQSAVDCELILKLPADTPSIKDGLPPWGEIKARVVHRDPSIGPSDWSNSIIVEKPPKQPNPPVLFIGDGL